MKKRGTRELTKRYLLFIFSLFVSALGVAITKRGNLGVSPVSSVANILSIRFTVLTMGNWLIIWNCVLIVGQILLLKSKFQWIQLLQVPLSFLFGYFTDFGMWLVGFLPADVYRIRLAMVFVGTFVLGIGVALSVCADVIMNSGEAFVKALSETIHKNFGDVKIGFDVSCVTISVLLSLLFFGGQIKGTREGTLIAAILTGLVVKFVKKAVEDRVETLLA